MAAVFIILASAFILDNRIADSIVCRFPFHETDTLARYTFWPANIFVVEYKLLSMSITASWLILAVIILRLLLRKAPKWVNCLLWGIAAVRLICPFSFESTFSLIPGEETINSNIVRYSSKLTGYSEAPVAEPFADLDISENSMPMVSGNFASTADAGAGSLAFWRYAGIVWIIGLSSLLGYGLVSYFRMRRRISEAVPIQASREGFVSETVFPQVSRSSSCNVWIGDMIRSPFILGLIRPKIVLSSSTEESQMGYILAHEQAHIKRKDHWWKLIGFLLLAVYWFNPLSWAAYILLCRDIELACDEKVVRGLDENEKKLYLKALVSCSTQRRTVMACPLAFGEVGVKQRVKSALRYKKPAFWVVLVSVFACVVVAVCFFTTSPRTYQIRVTIPADGTDYFYYTDEEISPKGRTLTLYAGEGMGDGEIVLLPLEADEENAYDDVYYITPGMPVKIDVEKGAWFKAGVNSGQNLSGEDRVVYLSVENVEVRSAVAKAEDEGRIEAAIAGDEGKITAAAAGDGVGAQDDGLITGKETRNDGSISGREAEERLQRYLSAAGEWSEEYALEPLNPVIGMVEDTEVYRFEVRYQDAAGQAAGRLAGNYAITIDGNTVYWYDPANDEFIVLREAGQDIAPSYPNGTSGDTALPYPNEANGDTESPYPAETGGDTVPSYPEKATSLADALPMEFLSATGASSAGTTLTLNQDGSFVGQHYDHENAAGSDHPKGICYICYFSGWFEEVRQINEYTYSMTLGEIITVNEEGEEWIEDGILYIASEPFGMEDGKEFLLYLPGTPLEELSEEFLSWWMGWWSYAHEEENPQILPCYGLLNVETGRGFFHYE